MEAKKSPLQHYLNSLVLWSSLLLDKFSHLMVKNHDLSSVFLQINRKFCLLLNSGCILVVVLVFTDFFLLLLLKGFSLLQAQRYFNVVVDLSDLKKRAQAIQEKENIFCVIVVSANPKKTEKYLNYFCAPCK